jgi:hypothetical protein
VRPFHPFQPFRPFLAGASAVALAARSGVVLDANTVRVAFSQCVDIVAVTSIQVNIGGAGWEEVAAVASGADKVWEFTTTTDIAEGDSIEWQYLGGEDSIVDCVEAADVGPLGPKAVTNGLELTAPTLDSIEVGTVADNVFVLTFSEEVASTDFTLGWIIEAAETELTLEDAEVVSPGVVHITTTESVYEGQEVLASYDAGVGDIVDVSGYPDGNPLASITEEAVTNNSETPLPILWSRDLTTLAVGADATFGRASAGYHQQPDSNWFIGYTAEARFKGARRVVNILKSSDNLLSREWVTSNTTVTSGVADPIGGATAYTITATASNGQFRQLGIPNQTGLAAACSTSIWIRRRAGVGTIILYNPQAGANITVSVTASWRRLFVSTTTVSSPQFYLSLAFLGDAVDIWHPMIGAHAEAAPLPPEYVSTGVPTGINVAVNGTFDTDTGYTKGEGWAIEGGVAVATATIANLTLPAAVFTPVVGKTYRVSFDAVVTSGIIRGPFKTLVGDNISVSGSYTYTHTATATTEVAVDGVASFTGTIDNLVIQECGSDAVANGVKYFSTANGNTVDAGYVVTETTGAALPGPFGLLMEPLRTNNLLNSGAPATQTTASLTTGTYCLWVEGTGSAAVTAGTATLTGNGTASAGTPNVFQVTGAGTVTVTITGTLTKFQLENGAEPSSYIATAGAAVSRDVDTLAYTGVPADNETRFVIDEANVDADDWNGTMATPTTPDVLSSITVYAPGQRPA